MSYTQTTEKSLVRSVGEFLTFVLLVVLIRSLLFSPFRIPSGSMIPTLKVGDFIVTNKFSYGWSRYSLLFGGYFNYFKGRIMDYSFPDRGDVIVFANPSNTEQDWIKRVVAVQGDTVQMIDGRLHLNNVKLPLEKEKGNYTDHDGEHSIEGTVYSATIPKGDGKECHYKILKQYPFGEARLDNTPILKVPEESVFLMGDNWDGSGDSRAMEQLGFVHKNYFVGPALFIFLSLDHQDIYWWKPWTWLMIPFKIRYGRIFNKIK